MWSEHKDLNLEPDGYKPPALPDCAIFRCAWVYTDQFSHGSDEKQSDLSGPPGRSEVNRTPITRLSDAFPTFERHYENWSRPRVTLPLVPAWRRSYSPSRLFNGIHRDDWSPIRGLNPCQQFGRLWCCHYTNETSGWRYGSQTHACSATNCRAAVTLMTTCFTAGDPGYRSDPASRKGCVLVAEPRVELERSGL